MDSTEITPQVRIWQLSLGFAHTAVLYVLVRTGIIEDMRQQPRTLSQLARTCELNSDVLFRILRFAVAIGVVRYNEGQYSLTETGTFLLKDVPGSLHTGILLYYSEPWQRSWQNLTYSLTTGGIAFEKAMGDPFFTYLEKHPEYGTPFHQWMTISTTIVALAVAEAYDFTGFKSACDIGGGQGILLRSILTANPHLHGILFDQEHVLKDHVLTDFAERVEFQIGNFFERVPAAEILMMKSVLHDWSDEKCQVILSHCRQTMQPSSRLLIIERVIESQSDLIGAFFDLHMQVISGGKERTETEFRALLNKAGMKLNRIVPTNSSMKIVEASLL